MSVLVVTTIMTDGLHRSGFRFPVICGHLKRLSRELRAEVYQWALHYQQNLGGNIVSKQRTIISDVNMMSGVVTFEYMTEKHGKQAVERCLSRGFIKLDETGMLSISDTTYQLYTRMVKA